ncbi:MAG: hypothetical protein ACFFDK_12545 [Promethearchaeota archaeon]
MNDDLYKEKIFLKATTISLAIVTLIFLLLLISEILFTKNIFLTVLVFFLFVGFILLTFNFNTLTIRINPHFIKIAYGIFNRTTSWENIRDCYLDNVSNLRYGGLGIRYARVKGKWRVIYNTYNTARVVLVLRKGKIKEIVFSTKNPEEAMKLINQQIRK